MKYLAGLRCELFLIPTLNLIFLLKNPLSPGKVILPAGLIIGLIIALDPGCNNLSAI